MTTSASPTSQGPIPIIDISQATPQEVADAMTRYACMFITGHGVSSDLVERMTAVSDAFFDVPVEQKRELIWDGQGIWNGWQPDGAAQTQQLEDKTTQLVEWYMIHEPETYSKWPSQVPGFRDIWLEYYGHMHRVSSTIITLLADGLGLPASDVLAWTEHQFANLCVNHYPAQLEPPQPGQERLSPHSDEGGITILTSKNVPGGLQIRLPGTREWTPVTFPDGAFLVQAADLLARWTNRVVPPNMHRVVNPERSVAAQSRRNTIVYFHCPALDTLITPDPGCVERVGRTVYQPVTAYDHVVKRQDKYSAAPEFDLADQLAAAAGS